ncbi:probable deoxyhypusine synthase, partial [Penaeus monodon]|uniref:probable deoxyhypusine synthase n=1 Tax=Penaeus monodon TaxID=6687 RepID=UPI0018A779A0
MALMLMKVMILLKKIIKLIINSYLLSICFQIECRESSLPEEFTPDSEDEFIKIRNNCTIFLGYTSNMVSCGVRETIRFLVEHHLVDCLVTTAGGVEEDLIKCLAPTYLGDWYLKGKELRMKGLNRIGNLIVPNDNYCKFEDWVTPLLDKMLEEQQSKGIVWPPSKIIARLGEEMG